MFLVIIEHRSEAVVQSSIELIPFHVDHHRCCDFKEEQPCQQDQKLEEMIENIGISFTILAEKIIFNKKKQSSSKYYKCVERTT